MPNEIISGLVKVRVLTTCSLGQANEVIELSAEEAKAAVGAGLADDNPDAVAYAETLA